MGVGFAVGLGFEIAVGESSGAVLLVAVGLVGASAATVLAVMGGRDLAPVVPADAPPPQASASAPAPAARDSVFPGVCALGFGLAAVGAAAGPTVMVLALVVTLVGAAAGFGQSWREHPSWTPRVRERVRYRLLVPAALPFPCLGLAASLPSACSPTLFPAPGKG